MICKLSMLNALVIVNIVEVRLNNSFDKRKLYKALMEIRY